MKSYTVNTNRFIHSLPSAALSASGIMGIISACELLLISLSQAPLYSDRKGTQNS